MRLYADSGSTKTTWCIYTDDASKLYFNSEGYNPNFVNEKQIHDSLNKAIPNYLNPKEITSIDFYGAGCSSPQANKIVKKGIAECFPAAKIFIHHDLLGAARALLKDKEGFAAILGTGSNSCIYNGYAIQKEVNSLGFYLGDEGSGAHLGKKILREYFRNRLPNNLAIEFKEMFKLSKHEILDKIYYNNFRNRFCASFAIFISKFYEYNIEYFDQILISNFEDFFNEIVKGYPNYQNYKFNSIGSIGYTFKNILSYVTNQYGMKIGKIIRSPIEEIVDYHIYINNNKSH